MDQAEEFLDMPLRPYIPANANRRPFAAERDQKWLLVKRTLLEIADLVHKGGDAEDSEKIEMAAANFFADFECSDFHL